MDWLEALAVPALLGMGGLIAWVVKSRLEEIRAAQERLASERRKLYADLLDPYIKIFARAKSTSEVDADATAQAASHELLEQVSSVEYRRTALEVVLIGSDEVVDAYNDLMQRFYKGQADSPQEKLETMRLYAVLLLAIRKSLGNATTPLDEWDMLRHMITDIDEYLANAGIETRARAKQQAVAPQGEDPP